jgi:hypothetical protein
LHRRGERVLDRLLGDVDVTEDADHDGHRAALLLAEHALAASGGHAQPDRRELGIRTPSLYEVRTTASRPGGSRRCGVRRGDGTAAVRVQQGFDRPDAKSRLVSQRAGEIASDLGFR